MNSIGIVTNSNSHLASFLKRNAGEIFDGFVNINNHYISEMIDGYMIKDDIVLVMINEKALEIEKYVANKQNIIVVDRTIKENEVYKIFNIPKDTKVLVVNDSKETTLETVSLLYSIGVNNLCLIPYEAERDYKDIKFAVTPGEACKVPSYIEKIIDIGNRCIDISTFLNVTTRLKLDNKTISRRLVKYSEEIVSLDNGIKSNYKELYVKNTELDTIINMSKEGTLLLNTDGSIALCNNTFKNIFNIKDDCINKNIEAVLDKKIVEVLRKEPLKEELLDFCGKSFILNKESIDYFGEKKGCYININEITYIKQLEQNLSNKLKNKGLIARYNFDYLKTNSESMQNCISLAKKIANSELTVLISGESGTGKELLAQSIHNASARSKYPFVAINCAAVPENLLESELLGYDGGSFTGALKEGKAGLFEQANNGTILLDEIGDMPISLQARLLRVLQERQVMRIGSQRVMNINIRIIAATNKNLMEMIEKGYFREDLFYRLNVLPINVPPLRKRRDDILPLLKYFIGDSKKAQFSYEVTSMLLNYPWPGNIRELQNVASYISLMGGNIIELQDLPYYLVNHNFNFEKELNYLESKNSLLDALEILKILEKYNSMNMGVGRKQIEEILSKKSITLSESEIRRILLFLKELDLISSNVGRHGSEITPKGSSFINWLINRLK